MDIKLAGEVIALAASAAEQEARHAWDEADRGRVAERGERAGLARIKKQWPVLEHLSTEDRSRQVSQIVRDSTHSHVQTSNKRCAKRQARHLDEAELSARQPVAGRTLEDRVCDDLLLAGALKTLTADQRAVIKLRFWADQTDSAIAQALGISLAATKARTHRALRSLRRYMVEHKVPMSVVATGTTTCIALSMSVPDYSSILDVPRPEPRPRVAEVTSSPPPAKSNDTLGTRGRPIINEQVVSPTREQCLALPQPDLIRFWATPGQGVTSDLHPMHAVTESGGRDGLVWTITNSGLDTLTIESGASLITQVYSGDEINHTRNLLSTRSVALESLTVRPGAQKTLKMPLSATCRTAQGRTIALPPGSYTAAVRVVWKEPGTPLPSEWISETSLSVGVKREPMEVLDYDSECQTESGLDEVESLTGEENEPEDYDISAVFDTNTVRAGDHIAATIAVTSNLTYTSRLIRTSSVEGVLIGDLFERPPDGIHPRPIGAVAPYAGASWESFWMAPGETVKFRVAISSRRCDRGRLGEPLPAGTYKAQVELPLALARWRIAVPITILPD